MYPHDGVERRRGFIPLTMERMLLLMSLLARFVVAEVLLGDVDEPRK